MPEQTEPLIVLPTGQTTCHGVDGREVPCAGSGQDAETAPDPNPFTASDRFRVDGDTATDALTGLVWSVNANPLDFPMTWAEALAAVQELNAQSYAGRTDWRLPNRRELRSLVSHGHARPALPQGHPFSGVVQNWYWTSTTSAMHTAYAWYVHLAGARMFYGRKDQYCLVWPVAGTSHSLPRTGQDGCFGPDGEAMDCSGSGQDGELRLGSPWPEPRFELQDGGSVLDRLTGLIWRRDASGTGELLTWAEALDWAASLPAEGGEGWRLPDINELESLVDCSRARPALPEGHPFTGVAEAYWSATTSAFEPDWAYCLYMHKGAVGVCHKPGREFSAWAVSRPRAHRLGRHCDESGRSCT